MNEVLGALAPVFLLILLGWAVRAARLLPADALGAVNRFGYFVLYPAFLFTTIASASLASADALPFLGGVMLAFLCVVALMLGLRPFFRDGPGYTSVFQGAARWNGFAILAAGNEIFGPLGRPYIALAFGPAVLMLNIISVGVLARWGENRQTSWRFLLAQVAGNPLVLACVAGLAALALGAPDLGPVSDALQLLGQAAMPVALICVGAGIDLRAARSAHAKVALSTAVKLVAAPLIFYAVVRGVGAGPVAAAIAAGIGSTPTAAASYTLAREMGGDARLMAAIVSVTTLMSFVTMPIAITLALAAP
ncbi:MAG: AEC family transporter [Hyphomonadaceae bacterium]|nr:AEC family transporter [Hyphomonadaceae bacterium]